MKLRIILLSCVFFGYFSTASSQYTSSGYADISTIGKTYFVYELGLASPIGATKNFDINDTWENALGAKNGFCFGMSHNSTFNSTSNTSLGVYGQFVMQINGMNTEYEDYGYELDGIWENLRIEYEIGPSLTLMLNENVALDAYLKGGLAWISAPYMFNDNYEYSMDLGEALGFVYGFGVKLRFDEIVLGLDVNPGNLNFSGDYKGVLPISYTRFTIGLDIWDML